MRKSTSMPLNSSTQIMSELQMSLVQMTEQKKTELSTTYFADMVPYGCSSTVNTEVCESTSHTVLEVSVGVTLWFVAGPKL